MFRTSCLTWLAQSLCLIAVLLAGRTAQATPQAPTLRLMLNDVAPYTIKGDSLRPGMHQEVMQELLLMARVQAETSVVPYVRIPKALREEVVDAVVGVDTPELNQLGVKLGDIHSFRSVVLPRADLGITTIEQLKGRLLGMARGAYYDPRINDDAEIRKFGIPDPFQGVRMLSAGRLDAVISSDYLLSYALKQEGLAHNQFGPLIEVNIKGYSLYASRTLPSELASRLRRALDEMHRSGRIAAIVKRYQ